MDLQEARSKGVCRVCGEPIRVKGPPKNWQWNFGSMTYPVVVTLNFGSEFAHTECLDREHQKEAMTS